MEFLRTDPTGNRDIADGVGDRCTPLGGGTLPVLGGGGASGKVRKFSNDRALVGDESDRVALLSGSHDVG